VWLGDDGVYYWRTHVTSVVPSDYRHCRLNWVDACTAADAAVPPHFCRCVTWPEDDLNLVEAAAWREWLEAASEWERELRSAIEGGRFHLLDSAVSVDASIGYATVSDQSHGVVIPIRVSFEQSVSPQQRRADIQRQIPSYIRSASGPRIAARARGPGGGRP
jgi:hypothetical protein